MAKVVWYSVPEVCGDERFRLSLAREADVARPYEQEGILEECAEDFYEFHDGYECNWPLEFRLFQSEEGPQMATAKVCMELQPRFSGRLHSSTERISTVPD